MSGKAVSMPVRSLCNYCSVRIHQQACMANGTGRCGKVFIEAVVDRIAIRMGHDILTIFVYFMEL